MKIKDPFFKILLLVIFVSVFCLMIFSVRADSQTTDEAIHLFSGFTYLTQRDFRLDSEHPPLLKELSALPLLFFQNLQAPLDGFWNKAGNFYFDSWSEARKLSESFFYSVGNNPAVLLFWGRLPFIILTLILGLAGFCWAKAIYGKKAGVFAAFLILFLPNILAHGRLINTDLGVTFFIFLMVYLWGNFLKKPNFLNMTFAGLSLGLVLASKFTGLLILPILLLLALIKVIFFDENKKIFFKYLAGFLGALIISFIVIWATYGFRFKIPPFVPSGFVNAPLWGHWQLTPALSDFVNRTRPVLFPADYYKGMFLVLKHTALGHGSFLLGRNSSSGWWYYFPVAFFYKTPIPIFIFLGLAIVFFKRIQAKNIFDEILLIVPPVVFLILSMFSKADLGVRHILPIMPFLLVFAAKSINLIDFKKLLPAVLFSLLIIWYLISTVLSFPNFLAYFNEFAGGAKGGYKILADSNLDWGQDMYRLKNYLEQNNIDKIYIVYPWNGDMALNYYGINFEPLRPEDQNIKGTIVVSATYFQTEAYGWLKKYPFDQITPGLFVFHLE